MSGMIKKMLCVATIGAGVSLAYLASATAPGDGEPPPPPVNDCTPGFWKNHTELWATYYCGSEQCVLDALEDLTARGPGSDAIRHGRAADLNAWADDYFEGMLVCPD